MPSFLFKSRSARMNDINAATSVLCDGDHRLYSFHCLVRLGPLALAAWACPLALNDGPGGDCWSMVIIRIGSRILLRGRPRLSLGLWWFRWWLLAFRIGRRITGLGGLFILFRNIWIREGRREDAHGHAGCGIQSLQILHYLDKARWRIVAVSGWLENPHLASW